MSSGMSRVWRARRPRLVAWMREVEAEWSLRHTLFALVIGALTLFAMGTPLAPSPIERSLFVPLAYNVLQFGFPLVFAVRVADHAVGAGVGRLRAYGSAVLVVTLAGVWVIARLLWPILGREPDWSLANDIWLALNTQLFHALGVAVYAQWRREQQARERLMAAQRAQAERQRQLAAARLLALQAQVEPGLLFDTLRRVQQGIDPGNSAADSAGADGLLRELIALLRLLLPRSDATASTFSREIALIRAYTRLAGLAALAEPRLLWVVGVGAAQARLAPMWLLTMLREQAAAADAAASWVVSAQRDGERLRIVVVATQGDLAAQGAAAGRIDAERLQAQLREVHGASARLVRGVEPHVLWIIELPYQAEQASRLDDDHAANPDR
jgi:hypothetical protein